MEFAVIILNYNSKEKTKNCIESFKKDLKNKYYFIVVDNNSKEDIDVKFLGNGFINYSSKENINKNNYLIKLNENNGYSYSNNVGLKIANKLNFEYAIVANPDTEIIDISKINEILDYDFLAFFPYVVDTKNNVQSIYYDKTILGLITFNYLFPIYYIFNKIRKNIDLKKASKVKIMKIDYSIGCFIIFNLEKFKQIGYFDEKVFLYGEEQILYYKARKSKNNIYFDYNLKVKHNHVYKKMNEEEELRKKIEHKKSRTYYYKKYKKYPQFIINFIEYGEKIRQKIKWKKLSF